MANHAKYAAQAVPHVLVAHCEPEMATDEGHWDQYQVGSGPSGRVDASMSRETASMEQWVEQLNDVVG